MVGKVNNVYELERGFRIVYIGEKIRYILRRWIGTFVYRRELGLVYIGERVATCVPWGECLGLMYTRFLGRMLGTCVFFGREAGTCVFFGRGLGTCVFLERVRDLSILWERVRDLCILWERVIHCVYCRVG